MNDVIKISEIKEKIEFHLKTAETLQNALNILTGEVSVQSLRDREEKPTPQIYKSKSNKTEKTFIEKVTEILRDSDEPLKARDFLLSPIFQNVAFSTFSAQLSNYVSKGKIVKIENKGTKNNAERFFYKLAE